MSGSVPVSTIMCSHPVTVRPHHSVRSAAAVLLGHGLDAAPVVTAEGEVRGVVDEVELVRGLSDDPGKGGSTVVADVMTPAPPIIGPDEDVRHAVEILLAGARAVPVVEDGHLVGVVGGRDLVEWFAEPDPAAGSGEVPGRAAIYTAISGALSSTT